MQEDFKVGGINSGLMGAFSRKAAQGIARSSSNPLTNSTNSKGT